VGGRGDGDGLGRRIEAFASERVHERGEAAAVDGAQVEQRRSARPDRSGDHVAWGELVREPAAAVVEEKGSLAAQCLAEQQAVRGQRGGMELDELEVGQRRAGAPGEQGTLSDRAGRVCRPLPERGHAPGREHRRRCADRSAVRERPDASAAVLTEREDTRALRELDARVGHSALPESPSDVPTGLRPTGVDDAAARMSSLEPEPEIEANAELDEAGNAFGGFRSEQVYGARPAQAATGAESVGGVERGGVVLPEGGGDTALRPPARGRCLRSPRRDERDGALLRGGERGGQPGEPRAHDQEVDPLLVHRPFLLVYDPEAKTSASSLAGSQPASENMDRKAPTHVTLAVVLQVRAGRLQVLLWERAFEPFAGHWSLPGGYLVPGETLEDSIRRHLAVKVDIRELSHLEQLETLSDPARNPSEWQLATTYLGLVPSDVDPALPADTRWHPVDQVPRLAFDHRAIVLAGRERLRAKLSYTNIGFALAPSEFTISELRELYVAALGHEVSATNLQRVLVRRRTLEPTGGRREPGRAGGRPAALYRFGVRWLEVTDQFAVLRPPGRAS
jgi:8-oxo-dGTP diphosphatase